MRSLLLFLLAMFAWSGSVLACASPAEEIRYRVEHETFGVIGEEILTVLCQDDQLIIERKVDVTVRLLFVTVYRHEALYTEVWQDDRLVRFESRTNANGERSTLVVQAQANGSVIVEGRDGQVELSDMVVPTDPWHQNIVDRALQFDRSDGHLIEVNVADAGADEILIDEDLICARKFVVTGKREQELWFGPDGTWLKSKILHESGAVTITRQQIT
ncbi:MAG: DUF6134 family protein [Geminicoccaceae bacterium]